MEGASMRADEIPVAHTPEGGWHGEMPPPILASCTEPLAPDAPDLRGMWKAYKVEQAGKVLDDHPLTRHVERIEQCGDRVVITAGKIIHDMRADSTLEDGVNDVMEMNLSQRFKAPPVLKNAGLEWHPAGTVPC